jgi:type VI secretion system TssR-like protein
MKKTVLFLVVLICSIFLGHARSAKTDPLNHKMEDAQECKNFKKGQGQNSRSECQNIKHLSSTCENTIDGKGPLLKCHDGGRMLIMTKVPLEQPVGELALSGGKQINLTGKQVLDIPLKYIIPCEGVSLTQENSRMPETPWIVYSDRIGNISTERPGGEGVYKTLGFLEKFYVLDESENELHIVKDLGITYTGVLSFQAVDYGYIKKDKMLLWPHCLVTKEGRIDIKAIPVNTTVATKKQGLKDYGLSFFEDPALTIKSEAILHPNEIYFIYKKTDKAVLGVKHNWRAGIDIADVVMGWIPYEYIFQWNHRVAIEPNWEEVAARERRYKGIKTTVFIDALSATGYGDGGVINENQILWDSDTYNDRPIGEWRRFPILDMNDKMNLYHIAIIGEMDSSDENRNHENKYLYLEAYTPISHKDLNYPLYDRVLLLTRQELSGLLNRMEKLAEAKSSANRRILLLDIWKELLRVHIGEASDEILESMTMEEATEKVFGLPGTSGLLKEVRLKDIVGESISEVDISRYCVMIDRRYDRLQKIFRMERYPYSFSINDETYYWIPESLLP